MDIAKPRCRQEMVHSSSLFVSSSSSSSSSSLSQGGGVRLYKIQFPKYPMMILWKAAVYSSCGAVAGGWEYISPVITRRSTRWKSSIQSPIFRRRLLAFEFLESTNTTLLACIDMLQIRAVSRKMLSRPHESLLYDISIGALLTANMERQSNSSRMSTTVDGSSFVSPSMRKRGCQTLCFKHSHLRRLSSSTGQQCTMSSPLVASS